MKRLKVLFVIVFLAAPCGLLAGEVEEVSTADLKKMLGSIEGELKSRGVAPRGKYGRLNQVDAQLKKIANKRSMGGAVIGGILTAAATAHPAGLLLGGAIGALVGKSKNYEETEGLYADIEQEIIVDEDDFLTEGEVMLERLVNPKSSVAMADRNLPPLDDMAPTPESMRAEVAEAIRQQEREVLRRELELEAREATVNMAKKNMDNRKPYEAGSCYTSDKNATRDQRAKPHCFYMMY